MVTTKKWSVLWGALLLAAIGVLVQTGCTPAGPRALLDGERLIHQGRYDLAIERLTVATRLLPKSAPAWNHLGLAYHGARQWSQAARAYQQALLLDRDLSAAYYNLGCLWLEQNNPAAAQSSLMTFTFLQRNSAEGWLKLATAQLRLRQLPGAEENFHRSLSLKPHNPEALNGLGLVQVQRNLYREAFNNFAAALQQQPDYGPALLNEAIVLHQYAKNLPVALQKYQQYLALKPRPANWEETQNVARQLANTLQPPPQPKFPGPITNEITKSAPTNALPSGATSPQRMAMAASAPPAVISTLAPPVPNPVITAVPARAVQPSPAANPPISDSTVTALSPPEASLLKSPRPSETTLAKRTETEPPKLEPRASPPEPLATNKAAFPAKTEAIPPRTSVTPPVEPPVTLAPLATLPPPPRLLQPLPSAATSASSSNVASASPTTNATTKSAPPAKPGFFQRLNPVRLFRGKPKTTGKTPLDSGRQMATNSPPKATELPGAVSAPAAPSKETEKNLPPAIVSIRPEPARYSYRAPAKPAEGNRQEADVFVQRALEHQRQGRLSQAIEAYQQAIRRDPAFFAAQYNLGVAALDADQWALALLANEYALAIEPAAVNARFNFALVLQKSGYPVDAAVELEKLLAGAPNDVRAHLTLANLYSQQLAQPKSAGDHYRKVLELDPRHPQATAIRYWLAAHP